MERQPSNSGQEKASPLVLNFPVLFLPSFAFLQNACSGVTSRTGFFYRLRKEEVFPSFLF